MRLSFSNIALLSVLLDSSKNKSKTNKRRKADEEDKKSGLKRLKTEVSDLSESSDSEISNKRSVYSSSEQSSENELRCKNTCKTPEDEEKSQGSQPVDMLSVSPRLSPWDEMQVTEKSGKPVAVEMAQRTDSERRSPLPSQDSSCTQNQGSGLTEVQSCIVEMKSTVKTLPKDQYGPGMPVTLTPKCVIDITEDTNTAPSSRESSEAVSALLASQKGDVYGPESRQQNALGITGKMEFAHSEVIRPVTSVSESAALGERGKLQKQYASMVIKNALLTEDIRKPDKLSPSPDLPKPKSNTSPDILKPKCTLSPDIVKSKAHSVLESSKPKPNISPEVSKHKLRHPDNRLTAGRSAVKLEQDIPRSSFKPVPPRGTLSESAKSQLVVEKNEHFTIYRDPALVRPESENNHMTYLHPHLHSLHTSSHGTCLTPSSHHPSHLLPSSSIGHPVHHPHLLPSVLPTIPPGSILSGHPRLDSGLGHLTLAHHHPHQQQQFLQQQLSPSSLLAQTHGGSSYNQLGLYPIIWQYPNGAHSYPPGYKWVHPENAVNSDSSLRRVNVHLSVISNCLCLS